MQTSLTCRRCLILCAGLRCSWGMRQTQKGIITFLPKHRNSMNYLRYTRRAPRQLRDWAAQDSVREPGGQGPTEEPGGNQWGSRGNERGEIKWQKKPRKEARDQGNGAHARTQICWTACVCASACIYHRYRRRIHTGIAALVADPRVFPVNMHTQTNTQAPRNTFSNRFLDSAHIRAHARPNYHQSQASEPFPPRVHGSVFGSVSMQVGGLLILTTGLAHYTLMQHTSPLRSLCILLFLSFSTTESSYKTESSLCL